MPVVERHAAYARQCHPTIYGLYYNKDDPINPWVTHGYTRWPISEWRGVFGASYDKGVVLMDTHGTDLEGRKWEFFGFTIPLYDDNKT